MPQLLLTVFNDVHRFLSVSPLWFMCATFLGRALGELGSLNGRLGSSGVVVPDTFSCRSMPEWAALLEVVTQNWVHNFREDPLLALHAQDVFFFGKVFKESMYINL